MVDCGQSESVVVAGYMVPQQIQTAQQGLDCWPAQLNLISERLSGNLIYKEEFKGDVLLIRNLPVYSYID